MRLAARCLALAALSGAAISACSAPPAAPASAVEAAPDAVVPLPPGALNLLYNGAFEEWEGERPKGWAVAQGSGAEWAAVPPGRVKGLGRGSVGVELPPPPPGTVVILAQNLSARWMEPGRPLRFGAMVRADRPEQAQVVLQYQAGGALQKVRVAHPGDGEWVSLEETVTIPPDADPATFRIEMFRYPGGEGRVIFDHAGVAYADGAPPPAHEPSPGA